MRHLFLLALGVLAAACGTVGPDRKVPSEPSRPPSSFGETVRAEPPAVEIHQPSEGEPWRAVYRLEEPVRELRFFRDDNFRRAGEWNWRIRTPGYEFSRRGRHETLTLANGATAVKTLEIEFEKNTEQLPRDYELFEPFTDGSAAIYTGHFLVRDRDGQLITDFLLVPERGGRVLIEGRFRTGPVGWSDPEGHGTFAYFGDIRPIETDDMIAIVDPGMPEWVRVQGQRMLPAFFDLFSRELGADPGARPTVLFSFEDADMDNVRQNGGALPALVYMSIVGRRWREAEAQMSLSLFETLAHEAAHLWNGRMVAPESDSAAWLAEGGADALAWRALLQIGLMSPAEYEQRHRQALSDCTGRLDGRPVESVVARGDFKAAYSCGAVIFLWAEYAIAGGHRPSVVFGIWSDIINRAEDGGNTYGWSSFSKVLRSRGVTEAAVGEINRFLMRAMDDQAGYLKSRLERVGVRWY